MFSVSNWSQAIYHMKSSGLHQFDVSAASQHYHMSVNASLSINVLDRVSGLRLTTQRPYAVLHTDVAGSLFTEPILFTARY